MKILNLFSRKNNLIEDGVVLDKQFKPSLPLDIYQELPPMPISKVGPNGEGLFKMIADAYPEGVLYPQARENRIKLYQAIHFLRTTSSTPWVYDVEEPAYVAKVPLLTRVARTQHMVH
jgi:hypothetical protein